MSSIPVLIIPVLNRFDLLEQSLNSIDWPVDNIVVIDNSGELTLPDHPSVRVISLPGNIGVAASWNLGIKCFPRAPYWVINANDSNWLPGSLERLSWFAGPDKLVISERGFNAFALGSEIVKKIGIFDDNYYPAYYEDTDYERRVRQHGLDRQIIYPDIFVELTGTETTARSDPKFMDRKRVSDESNLAYYLDKFASDAWTRKDFDLQRWIDNDWMAE